MSIFRTSVNPGFFQIVMCINNVYIIEKNILFGIINSLSRAMHIWCKDV